MNYNVLPIVIMCPTSSQGAPPERILLVEDHEDTAYVIGRFLQPTGYDVRTVSTLADAKRACDAESFDLLVCDLDLPDGQAYGLLEYARQTCPTTRGIVLSGHGMHEHLAESAACGYAVHLVKPVPLQTVLNAIQKVLAGEEPETQQLPNQPDRARSAPFAPIK